jgi:uncharacterized protein
MSGGLLALLDDVAAIAKVAAASVDDVAAQAAKAGAKAAGIVIDDAAVTPRYVVGFAADRELPIIGRIAWGSLKNKLLFLLPGALALNYFAPWAITPLLIIGGAYLCFEGYEKVHEMVVPHGAEHAASESADIDPETLENEKVSGAIRTDVILSAEIMAITLSTVAAASFWTQASVLAVVGVGITAIVYGAVALIVKADDFGVALAKRGGALQTLGLGIVKAMPVVLKVLSIVGTLAMLWVGGGIIIHSVAGYGLGALEHGIHAVAAGIAALLKPVAGLTEWLITATASGIFGLLVGFLVEKAVIATRSLRKPASH